MIDVKDKELKLAVEDDSVRDKEFERRLLEVIDEWAGYIRKNEEMLGHALRIGDNHHVQQALENLNDLDLSMDSNAEKMLLENTIGISLCLNDVAKRISAECSYTSKEKIND